MIKEWMMISYDKASLTLITHTFLTSYLFRGYSKHFSKIHTNFYYFLTQYSLINSLYYLQPNPLINSYPKHKLITISSPRNLIVFTFITISITSLPIHCL